MNPLISISFYIICIIFIVFYAKRRINFLEKLIKEKIDIIEDKDKFIKEIDVKYSQAYINSLYAWSVYIKSNYNDLILVKSLLDSLKDSIQLVEEKQLHMSDEVKKYYNEKIKDLSEQLIVEEHKEITLDGVLDKISKLGLEALSEEELKILHKESNK